MSGNSEARLVMPQMGESLTEGTVARWLRQVGDRVVRDEPVVEISTDKVDTELPAPASGVLKDILVPRGTTVSIGATLGIITPDAGNAAASAVDFGPRPAATSDPGAHFAPAHGPQLVSFARAAPGSGREAPAQRFAPAPLGRRAYSPTVLGAAARGGLPPDALLAAHGTGRGGRVTKRDIERLIEARAAAPPRTTSQAAIQSAAAGRIGAVSRIDVTRLLALARPGAAANERRPRIVAGVCAAALRALREFPALAAAFAPNCAFARMTLGVAVLSPDSDDFTVEQIDGAGELNLAGLTRAITGVFEKGAARHTCLAASADVSFVVADVAAAAGVSGDAIVGRIAALTIDAERYEPIAVGDAVAIRPVATLRLAVERRAATVPVAFRYLSRVRFLLEDPPAE